MNEQHRDMIGRRVRAFAGNDRSLTMHEGSVIAYVDRPTFVIRTDDDERVTWVADLCEVMEETLGAEIARKIADLRPEHRFPHHCAEIALEAVAERLRQEHGATYVLTVDEALRTLRGGQA